MLNVFSYKYAIVFDAGSSGTRMFIYKWISGFSAAKGDSLIIDQEESCKTNDKGIDKINDKQELIKSFKNCIQKAYEKVPNERKNRTHIFLAATAGMRLLEKKNKTKVFEVLNFAREYFASSEFLFKNDSQVRIISGQEEGINAWISINYFLDIFNLNTNPLDTVGALDLGGGSTQNVYVTELDVNDNNNKTIEPFFHNLRIYGVNFKPYSHSFLCWGINEISLAYKILAIQKFNKKASCLPNNFVEKINWDSLIESYCSNSILENQTINEIFKEMNNSILIHGSSDYDECLKQINLILPKTECNYDNCSFNGVYRAPFKNRKFYAFSNFYYAVKNTQDLLKKSFKYDMDGFINATKSICLKTFDELKELNELNKANIKDKHLANQCFANNFIISLLEAYGFTSFSNIEFTDKINDYSIGWTLGYLINELNRDDFLPYEAPLRKLPTIFYFPIVCFFSILIMLLVLYDICKSIKKQSSLKVKEKETNEKDTEQSLIPI